MPTPDVNSTPGSNTPPIPPSGGDVESRGSSEVKRTESVGSDPQPRDVRESSDGSRRPEAQAPRRKLNSFFRGAVKAGVAAIAGLALAVGAFFVGPKLMDHQPPQDPVQIEAPADLNPGINNDTGPPSEKPAETQSNPTTRPNDIPTRPGLSPQDGVHSSPTPTVNPDDIHLEGGTLDGRLDPGSRIQPREVHEIPDGFRAPGVN